MKNKYVNSGRHEIKEKHTNILVERQWVPQSVVLNEFSAIRGQILANFVLDFSATTSSFK